MVKPGSPLDLAYLVLKNRMLRKTPTAGEREVIEGVAADAVALMARVSAAAQLGDVDTLVEEAKALLGRPATTPKVERALGLALLDAEVYPESAQLLQRYVDFQMPGSAVQPFSNDAQALQQLAIAQSGAGDILRAVASLNALDARLRSEPETLGILAGRFKRQWLKTGSNSQVARRALALYESALAEARRRERLDHFQIIYNGVNAAYLQFAIGDGTYHALAEEILLVAEAVKPDYWSEATRAECLLLLQRHSESLLAYQAADRLPHATRDWTSTGQQALDILERQGRQAAGSQIGGLFRGVRRDFPTV
jgi:tetratricopeptide (TPR) repeat protein